MIDITKVQILIGYIPAHRIEQGMGEAIEWYVRRLR